MEYGKDYFGFVYIWYNRTALKMEEQDYEDRHNRPLKKHPRLYIGYHAGAVDDGYICSSSWMLASYKKNSQNFMRRILYYQTTNNLKELREIEQKWLNLIKDEELGTRFYNLCKKAQGNNKGHIPWNKGLTKDTDERVRINTEKAGKSLKGRITWMKGKIHTNESKQKIKKMRAQQVITEETRRKLSESGKKSINSGKFQKGHIKSEKNIIAVKLALTGIPRSEETRKKLSLANKGKKFTEEHKKKLSDARKKYYQQKRELILA